MSWLGPCPPCLCSVLQERREPQRSGSCVDNHPCGARGRCSRNGRVPAVVITLHTEKGQGQSAFYPPWLSLHGRFVSAGRDRSMEGALCPSTPGGVTFLAYMRDVTPAPKAPFFLSLL